MELLLDELGAAGHDETLRARRRTSGGAAVLSSRLALGEDVDRRHAEAQPSTAGGREGLALRANQTSLEMTFSGMSAAMSPLVAGGRPLRGSAAAGRNHAQSSACRHARKRRKGPASQAPGWSSPRATALAAVSASSFQVWPEWLLTWRRHATSASARASVPMPKS